MPYYTRTYNPQPTSRVTSQELKNEFQAIDNALDAVETDVGKGIRAPEATTVLPNAASRALKVLSFDGSGNPRTTIAETDLAAAITSAANAATSAFNATLYANQAMATLDSFDDRYLGAKASDPTLDNDGNALLTGAIYWNAAAPEMRVWTGSAWVSVANTTSSYAAAASASAAATSASNAATSASTASTQATNASNSAAAASSSASSASTSASNAAGAYATIASNYLTLDFSGDFGLITDTANSTSDYGVLA